MFLQIEDDFIQTEHICHVKFDNTFSAEPDRMVITYVSGDTHVFRGSAANALRSVLEDRGKLLDLDEYDSGKKKHHGH